jgi:hypothetical protein
MERNPTSHRYDNSECSICGYNESPCDRHRHDPSKGYSRDNIVIVCANHHRELHQLIEAIEEGEEIYFIPT